MKSSDLVAQCLCVLALFFASVVCTHLPYNPTRAFLSPKHNNTLAYVFSPRSSTGSRFQLRAFNLSKTLAATDMSFTTITASLPFDDGNNIAFTPVINDAGEISVFAGECTSGLNGSALWRFTPDKPNGNGTWTELTLTTQNSGQETLIGASNYLLSGISFSGVGPTNASTTKLYYFGGMCPLPSPEITPWTLSANYSNSMTVLSPNASSSPSSSSGGKGAALTYSLAISQSKNSPIAEAGFTMTPLEPSFSNSSDGIDAVQRNFLLLGGHTQNAFANMSQAALFSLPEETWSFHSINLPPISNEKSGLTARAGTPEIDSRSGHTAIMTEDGKNLVVLGGWVGNINTPADPQLLILDIAEGFGGSGDWAWSIPSQIGLGLGGGGLYGHDALMLPGGVMMVIGGYSISAVHSTKIKRADPAPNSSFFFFNVTSSTWLNSYTYPSTAAGKNQSGKHAPGGPLSTASKKAAFGSGLVLGLSAIVGAVAVGLWYSRRLKRHRDMREKELRELALGAARFHSSALGLAGIDGRGGEKTAADWMGDRERQNRDSPYPWASGGLGGGVGDGPGWRQNRGTEAERTGLLVEIPSPTRGLRRSLHARTRTGERMASYQMAPGFDDGRRSLGARGGIHPIDERDEYEQQAPEESKASDLVLVENTEWQSNKASAGSTLQDPFSDPPKRPAPASIIEQTDASRERALEIQEWVTDWAIADAILSAGGRTFPSRSTIDPDRTHSNLSERSTRSASSGPSQGTVSRSLSQRSNCPFSASNPFSSPNPSPTFDQQGRRSPTNRRSQSLSNFPRPGSGGENSFNTAVTSFSQLQADGEGLLRRPGNGNMQPDSPTKSKSKAPGWMGSIKRALGGDRSVSPVSSSTDRSTASSPTKDMGEHEAANLPRRAASASAMLWRKKQGAADWDVEGSVSGAHSDYRDEEWDVEAAVEQRVVQVMFTVPKEKLRVVNADRDAVSEEDVESDQTPRPDKGKGKEVIRNTEGAG